MSHLTPVAIDSKGMTVPKYIVKAIEAIGYKAEVFDEPVDLEDYYGEKTGEIQAQIVLRKRDNLRDDNSSLGLKADAGFLLNQETGEYELIADDLDHNKFDPQKLNKLYFKHRIEDEVTEMAKKANRGNFVIQWVNDDEYGVQFEQDKQLVGAIY